MMADDLHDGFDFAVFVRCNDDAFINGHCSQTGHGKFPANDDDSHPRRTHPSSTNMIRMEQISNLSARGSRNFPKLVTIFPLRQYAHQENR